MAGEADKQGRDACHLPSIDTREADKEGRKRFMMYATSSQSI